MEPLFFVDSKNAIWFSTGSGVGVAVLVGVIDGVIVEVLIGTLVRVADAVFVGPVAAASPNVGLRVGPDVDSYS